MTRPQYPLPHSVLLQLRSAIERVDVGMCEDVRGMLDTVMTGDMVRVVVVVTVSDIMLVALCVTESNVVDVLVLRLAVMVRPIVSVVVSDKSNVGENVGLFEAVPDGVAESSSVGERAEAEGVAVLDGVSDIVLVSSAVLDGEEEMLSLQLLLTDEDKGLVVDIVGRSVSVGWTVPDSVAVIDAVFDDEAERLGETELDALGDVDIVRESERVMDGDVVAVIELL